MTDLTPRPDAVPPLAPGRSCEGCTACCKLPSVDAMRKPMQQWCEQCEIGRGCRIYGTRPDECRTFFCGWVLARGANMQKFYFKTRPTAPAFGSSGSVFSGPCRTKSSRLTPSHIAIAAATNTEE